MARGYSNVTPERRARVERARQLRGEGLLQREIAKKMGIKRSAVSDLLSDPWREKAQRRRLEYGGECEECGAPTDGSAGPSIPAPARCLDCAAVAQHENRKWTRQAIIDAVRRFADENGRQPLSQEWLYNDKRPEWAPYVSVVLREFGKWSAAMKAAGFDSHVGIKIKKRSGLMYHVLAETTDGSWKDLGVFTGNREQAINTALTENPPENGSPPRLVLVHSQSWVPQTVTPVQRTVYTVSAAE